MAVRHATAARAGEGGAEKAQERLDFLEGEALEKSRRTGGNVASGISGKAGAVGKAAAAVTGAARAEFIELKEDAYGYGSKIGQRATDGLRSKRGAFGYAAALYGGKLADNLLLRSPAKEGQLSKAGDPQAWAAKGADLYMSGWATLVPKLANVFADLPTPALAGSVPGLVWPAAGYAGAGSRLGGSIDHSGEIMITVRDPDGGLARAGISKAELAELLHGGYTRH